MESSTFAMVARHRGRRGRGPGTTSASTPSVTSHRSWSALGVSWVSIARSRTSTAAAGRAEPWRGGQWMATVQPPHATQKQHFLLVSRNTRSLACRSFLAAFFWLRALLSLFVCLPHCHVFLKPFHSINLTLFPDGVLPGLSRPFQ